MTTDQIPEFLKSIYTIAWFLVIILFLVGFIIRGRTRRFNKAWAPLLKVVQGQVKIEHMTSTLSGEYHGRPVRATISRGGQDLPDTFAIEMSVEKAGRDWEIAHRSEKLLGPEVWRIFTKDPALQAQMEAAGVPACMREWPATARVRFDAARGALTLQEDIFSPTAGHFRAQLGLLEALAEVNARVNGD